MKFNPRSATVALMGFVCGLLVMYVGLLATVRPIGRDAQDYYGPADGATDGGIVRNLLRNATNQDDKSCADRSQTVSITCSPASPSSPSSVPRTSERPDVNVTWDALQQLRHLQMNKTCQRLRRGAPSPSALRRHLDDNDNIFIDDDHGVFFCAVPKAACSSWKHALAVLTRRLDELGPDGSIDVHLTGFMRKIGLPSPPDVSTGHLQRAVRRYTKILVVRHPFERLLSAYRDKFHTYNKWTKHFQFRYGRKIVLLYRGRNVSLKSLRKGHDVTFEEFLTFLVDDTVPLSERINPHWSTYQWLCHPCEIQYDHVIKFETMESDNDVILKRYFSVDNATEFFPKRNMKTVPSRDLMIQYYSQIPISLIYKVYEFFREDMEMFGYDLPPEILKK